MTASATSTHTTTKIWKRIYIYIHVQITAVFELVLYLLFVGFSFFTFEFFVFFFFFSELLLLSFKLFSSESIFLPLHLMWSLDLMCTFVYIWKRWVHTAYTIQNSHWLKEWTKITTAACIHNFTFLYAKRWGRKERKEYIRSLIQACKCINSI